MQWVGKAGELQRAGSLPIAPGLYPVGTELFHTVRYLDVVDGVPTLARRMKEVRYAKKVRWESYAIARANATREAREEDESIDLVHDVHVQRELGVYNGRGWILSGFIEDAQGALRPQTSEELAACAGCHGGIGSTTDFTFALARKTSEGPAHGWFHWSQHDVRGLPEPKRADGQFEYTTYLSLAGAGDDTHDNAEIAARFFDERGALRASEVKKLHEDVATLLLPSPGRALDLDRAYKAIVDQQSFDKGRDVVLSARPRVHARVPVGEPTGVTSAASAVALSP